MQKILDIEKMEKFEEEASKIYDGKIVGIVKKTNIDYFPAHVQHDRERVGFMLIIEIQNKDKDKFDLWWSIPENPQGYKMSNVYAFKKKYGSYPTEGQKVKVQIGSKGFYEILLDWGKT